MSDLRESLIQDRSGWIVFYLPLTMQFTMEAQRMSLSCRDTGLRKLVIPVSTVYGSGTGTCSIGQDTISVGSCLVAHWHNSIGFQRWNDKDAYAEYVQWPFNTSSAESIAWGYLYWTLPWPGWAMHTIGEGTSVYIVGDFVFLDL